MSRGLYGKSTKFSLFSLATHELRRAQGILLISGTTRLNIRQVLIEHQSRQISNLTKYTIALFSLAAILNQADNVSVSKLPGLLLSIEVPKYYCQLIASSVFFVLILQMIGTLMTLVARELLKDEAITLHRFQNAKDFLSGDPHSDASVPFRSGSLISSKTSEFVPLILLYMTVFIAPVVAIFASAVIVFNSISTSIHSAEGFSIELIIPIVAMITLISAVSYLVIFFVPISVTKNKEAIRWLFLYPLNKDSNMRHPQADKWQDGNQH